MENVTETTITNNDAKLTAAWALPPDAAVDEAKQTVLTKISALERACRERSEKEAADMVNPLIKNILQGLRDIGAITDEKVMKACRTGLEGICAPLRDAVAKRLFNNKLRRLAETN
jgi:hypothetical protein